MNGRFKMWIFQLPVKSGNASKMTDSGFYTPPESPLFSPPESPLYSPLQIRLHEVFSLDRGCHSLDLDTIHNAKQSGYPSTGIGIGSNLHRMTRTSESSSRRKDRACLSLDLDSLPRSPSPLSSSYQETFHLNPIRKSGRTVKYTFFNKKNPI